MINKCFFRRLCLSSIFAVALAFALCSFSACGGAPQTSDFVSEPEISDDSSDGSESAEPEEKSYTITYDLGVNIYARLKSDSTKVVFGQKFTLEIPEYEGSAAFYGWYLADENGDVTDVRVEDGVYTYTRDILVVARWQEWSDVVS